MCVPGKWLWLISSSDREEDQHHPETQGSQREPKRAKESQREPKRAKESQRALLGSTEMESIKILNLSRERRTRIECSPSLLHPLSLSCPFQLNENIERAEELFAPAAKEH